MCVHVFAWLMMEDAAPCSMHVSLGHLQDLPLVNSALRTLLQNLASPPPSFEASSPNSTAHPAQQEQQQQQEVQQGRTEEELEAQ